MGSVYIQIKISLSNLALNFALKCFKSGIDVAPLKITDNLIFLFIAKGKKGKKNIFKKIKNKKVNKHTPFNKRVATGKKPKN